MKKHKVTIEVEFNATIESNFNIWVARMADRWQANVLHELDGAIVQQFECGAVSSTEEKSSLQQWIVEEYTKINQEFASGWEEVGDLLSSRDAHSHKQRTKDII